MWAGINVELNRLSVPQRSDLQPVKVDVNGKDAAEDPSDPDRSADVPKLVDPLAHSTKNHSAVIRLMVDDAEPQRKRKPTLVPWASESMRRGGGPTLVLG